MHGKNKQWNLRQGKKSGPRRVLGYVVVESGDLGDGRFYKIERADLSTGATEFGLRIFQQDAFGVLGRVSWKSYGELDHAQQAIQTRLADLRAGANI